MESNSKVEISEARNSEVDFSDAEHQAVVIIGSGPAGFTAAVYAARANLKPVMFQGPEPGGQLVTTTDVENYPGFPEGIMGPDMMAKFEEQAVRFGSDMRRGTVTHADFSERPFKMVVDEETPILADVVIISTGASAEYLGLESESRLLGRGVSACATCDGAFFRDVEIAVVGGGDTAMEEAEFLTRFASKVYLLHRRDELRASKIMQDRVMANDKIEILWNTEVVDVLGETGVTGLRIKNNKTGVERNLDVEGFFLAIGHRPNTGIFEGQLNLNEVGYINTVPGTTRTNIEGVFACGDAQDSVYRQAVTAAGTGCMAAIDAERWLAETSHVGGSTPQGRTSDVVTA